LIASDHDLYLHEPETDPIHSQRVRARRHILEQITTILLRQATQLLVENKNLDPRNRKSGLRVGDSARNRAGLSCDTWR